jgi:hypothetical protein
MGRILHSKTRAKGGKHPGLSTLGIEITSSLLGGIDFFKIPLDTIC